MGGALSRRWEGTLVKQAREWPSLLEAAVVAKLVLRHVLSEDQSDGEPPGGKGCQIGKQVK